MPHAIPQTHATSYPYRKSHDIFVKLVINGTRNVLKVLKLHSPKSLIVLEVVRFPILSADYIDRN